MLGLLAPVDPYRKVRRDYGIEFRRTPYIDTTFGEKNKKIIKNTRTIIILLVKIKKSKKENSADGQAVGIGNLRYGVELGGCRDKGAGAGGRPIILRPLRCSQQTSMPQNYV